MPNSLEQTSACYAIPSVTIVAFAGEATNCVGTSCVIVTIVGVAGALIDV